MQTLEQQVFLNRGSVICADLLRNLNGRRSVASTDRPIRWLPAKQLTDEWAGNDPATSRAGSSDPARLVAVCEPTGQTVLASADQPDDEQHQRDHQQDVDEVAQVYPLTSPSSHSTSRITAIVYSISLPLLTAAGAQGMPNSKTAI